ncbi:phosphoesterase [Arsukibacterium sp. MJ3]|uniref:metallophosphoesterase n=1 Tax=Arsukibacterium sp. MJ3 TaxID=1632859 RepID=UPI0006270D94|nr:metallophosphoesterase [Arsukibacterium sp. MJ3]KKO47609.1 phosphoesterase [Arsukibacterium sp. MJ3]
MKLQILSDIHLEFGNFDLPSTDADVLVVAGDLHTGTKGAEWLLAQNFDIPVIYVLGNHEYYKQTYPVLHEKVREVLAGSSVHFLENQFVDIDGVRFHGMTLWTDFEISGDARLTGFECQQRMNDYKKIKRAPTYSKIRPQDISVIHKQSLNWLENSLAQSTTATNVVVSHHAPSIKSVPEHAQTNPIIGAYVSNLEETIQRHKIALWLHGHIHTNADYYVHGCRVVCNPHGYKDHATNPDFNAGLVLRVSLN